MDSHSRAQLLFIQTHHANEVSRNYGRAHCFRNINS